MMTKERNVKDKMRKNEKNLKEKKQRRNKIDEDEPLKRIKKKYKSERK